MAAEAQISAAAAGMSARGDDGGGRDAPRERLGWVAVEEAGAFVHAGEGKGEGDGDGMTAAEEEAWAGAGSGLYSRGGRGERVGGGGLGSGGGRGVRAGSGLSSRGGGGWRRSRGGGRWRSREVGSIEWIRWS